MKSIHKFEIIKALANFFKISLLCKVAKVSKSGYYKNCKICPTISQDEIIVKEIFYANNAEVGSRTIKMEAFNKYGILMNRKKVQRIMKKLGLICKIRRKAKSNQRLTEEQYIKQNILNRNFKGQEVGTTVCTDITYFYYNNKKCYLTAYIDAKSGVILGHQLSTSLNRKFVIESAEKLFCQYPNIQMIHTDRGPQYTCEDFNKLTRKYRIVHSMSRPGTPLDNAPIESFWGHIKDYVSLKDCKTFNQVVDLINKYLYHYNYTRPQWNKKQLTPIQYMENLLVA